ncbi:unnamed protein product [Arctogadus glacialis]
MLCESRLWILAYSRVEEVASTPPESVLRSPTWQGTHRAAAAAACVTPASTRPSSRVPRRDSPHPDMGSWSRFLPFDRSSMSDPPVGSRGLGRGHISPEVEIPRQEGSVSDGPFLVPASCQLICQNYSDLCIRGDQVLPLSSQSTRDPLLGADTKAAGPFLQSCDVLREVEVSLPEQSSQAGPLRLLPRRTGSNRWRQGSGRDLSFLFHGREGPFTNSLLNCYLEHKLLDLNQQYILENMARDQAGGPYSDPPYPLMASELILTSLDQLTQQLSRERRLEAGLAKDMVISCFLRVASDMSGEISTPMLQFSEDPPVPQAEEALCEEELDRPAQLAQDLG